MWVDISAPGPDVERPVTVVPGQQLLTLAFLLSHSHWWSRITVGSMLVCIRATINIVAVAAQFLTVVACHSWREERVGVVQIYYTLDPIFIMRCHDWITRMTCKLFQSRRTGREIFRTQWAMTCNDNLDKGRTCTLRPFSVATL